MFKYFCDPFAIYFHNECFANFINIIQLSGDFYLEITLLSFNLSLTNIFLLSNTYIMIHENISFLFFSKIKISMYFHFLKYIAMMRNKILNL